MTIDGVVKPETQSINTGRHSSNIGMFMGNLDAGSHEVKIQYRGGTGRSNDPSEDWQGRGVRWLVLPWAA